MNTNKKIEIDELLMASVDEVLTPRQQTELARLLQHQPEAAEQLRAFERQRKLLCSLPIETAPASLVDEVKARMERKLILEGGSRTQGLRERGTLVRRRFMTAAAMLLLPLSLLGYVVYHIVAPTLEDTQGLPTAKQLLKDETQANSPEIATPMAPAPLPFDGVLILTTERPMLVAQSIEKQIFLRSMEHQTVPNRTAETTTFQMDCPAEALAEFMESLRPLWNQSTGVRLTLRDSDAPERTVTINSARPEQIQALVRQPDKMLMLAAARQYASATIMPLRPDAGQPNVWGQGDAMTPEGLSIPRPILAWPQPETEGKPEKQPHVRLMIEVRKPE